MKTLRKYIEIKLKKNNFYTFHYGKTKQFIQRLVHNSITVKTTIRDNEKLTIDNKASVYYDSMTINTTVT